MIEYENLQKTNRIFLKKFKNSYKKFCKDGKYILSNNVTKFEKKFSAYIGKKYCIGVGNGMDALTISLKSLNLPQNSEIIIASNAYIASILSAINANLKPILVEPDIQTYNLDYRCISKNITKKTKVIMVVHMYGKPNNMKEVLIKESESWTDHQLEFFKKMLKQGGNFAIGGRKFFIIPNGDNRSLM